MAVADRPRRSPAPRKPASKPAPRADTHVAREGKVEPRLPHELDQSSDQQHVDNAAARGQGRQAADAVARGHKDTGPAPVLERIARRHFKPSPGPGPRRG